MVAENPEKYYGLKVTNYESQNGQNDWKIFFSDWKEKSIQQNTENPTDTHIFLITGDYINTAETNRINSATEIKTSKYNVYWNPAANSQIDKISDEVKLKFKAIEYTLQSDKANSKCVSTLLNTDNWKMYLDNEDGTGNAEKAIGSPTIEMWMDSWNKRYSNDKLYRKVSTNVNKPGYYIGTDENQDTYSIDSEVMNKKEGYKNRLYYPHTSAYNGTNGYWFASPSAAGSTYMLYVTSYGRLNYSSHSSGPFGIRPVVSLKDGIMVNATDSE